VTTTQHKQNNLFAKAGKSLRTTKQLKSRSLQSKVFQSHFTS